MPRDQPAGRPAVGVLDREFAGTGRHQLHPQDLQSTDRCGGPVDVQVYVMIRRLPAEKTSIRVAAAGSWAPEKIDFSAISLAAAAPDRYSWQAAFAPARLPTFGPEVAADFRQAAGRADRRHRGVLPEVRSMAMTFNYAMIVLNRWPGKTSRFYVEGTNFTNTCKVMLDNKVCDKTTYLNSNILTVALKYGNWPMATSKTLPAAGVTGELTITITVVDGASYTTPTQVNVIVVNEDDLP